jgi:hypothetical protein
MGSLGRLAAAILVLGGWRRLVEAGASRGGGWSGMAAVGREELHVEREERNEPG